MVAAGVTFGLSVLLTAVVRVIAIRAHVLDVPDEPRKTHEKPMPLLGGLAPYLALSVVTLWLLWQTSTLTSGAITLRMLLGILTAGLVLMIGGALDDRLRLPAWASMISPLLAAAITIGVGIEVDKATNPFGGTIALVPWVSDVLVFGWLLVAMYTTKLMDGVDGLAAGVGTVGALMVALLAGSAAYYQPDVSIFAAVIVGALSGFLVWNAPPAKIYLGEGGSVLIGYLLAVLSVISGAKVATILLVVAVPLFDVAWTVLRRARRSGWRAIFYADRQHLHHRLLDLGWSPRRVWVTYVGLAAAAGLGALVLQSKEKLFMLLLLFMLLAAVTVYLARREERR